MRRRSFRDFYYDHSDIVLAVIILFIAAIVIMWRINIIVDYPNTLQDISGVSQTSQEQNDADGATAAESKEQKDSNTVIAAWTDDKLAEDIKVKVEGRKPANRIACLVDAGLFTSKEDFSNICTAADLNFSDIKKGTYKFKAGMTKEDIAKKVIEK